MQAQRTGQGGGTAKPLRRRRKAVRTPRLMAEWASGGRDKRCVICGVGHPVHGHHIVTQQKIRIRAAQIGVPARDVLWDRRNRLWLCATHHAEHHARNRPVSWSVLQRHAPEVFAFAAELDLVPWLERTYPQEPAS